MEATSVEKNFDDLFMGQDNIKMLNHALDGLVPCPEILEGRGGAMNT